LSVFLSRVAALTGIDAAEAAAKVSVSSPPKPLTHYPESRQAQMAGATLFQVTLQFTVTSTEEADRIISACLAAADSKTRPLAPATLEARRRLFSDFQLLSIKWVTEEGRVEGDGGYKSFCMGAKSRRRTIFLGSEVGHGQGWSRHG